MKGVKNIFQTNKNPKLTFSSNLLKIKKELKRKQKLVSKQVLKEFQLTEEEHLLIQSIKEQTKLYNRNNVTRTEAYLHFYLKYPEIHWALLGHMVSRNGGWNMTDLKGELLSNLLNNKEKQDYFTFLERGNWLIFQDVYPQFLLYEEGLLQKKNLFYLLPYFNVSIFMEVIWNYFLRYRDPYILAIALVINEQSYLEQRVIQNPVYKDKVLNTLEFKLQDLLSLNHILFPFQRKDKEVGMVGKTLHQFTSLHERIMLGKKLYELLYSDKDRLNQIIIWARTFPHTGSRQDYWPQLFRTIRHTIPGSEYKKRVEDCQLRKGAVPFYSPNLRQAWKDVSHKDAEIGDWFHDWKVIDYLKAENLEVIGEIEDEYCETIEKIELAILAKKVIFR